MPTFSQIEERKAESGENRDAQAAALLEELVALALRLGPPKCFADWPVDTVRAYILFHMRQKTFAFVRAGAAAPPCHIAGFGILWQGHRRFILARIQERLSPFHWQPSDAHGDCLYAGEWVCPQPGALRALIVYFKQRFPDWRHLPFIPVRRELNYA